MRPDGETTGIDIARLEESDAVKLARLHNRCFREEIANFKRYGYHHIKPREAKRWFERGRILAAKLGDGIVGYLHFATYEEGGKQQGIALETYPAWIGQSKIGVLPRARRRGVATMLVKAAIDQSRAQDCESFNVVVYSDNLPAISLVDKLGFMKIGPDVVLAETDLKRQLPKTSPPEGVRIEMESRENVDAYAEYFDRIRSFYGDYADAREYVEEVMKDPSLVGNLYAWVGDQVVGSIGAEKVATCGWIGLPGVVPEHRRRGIGTALMVRMLDILRDKGFEVALTDSETARQPALSLYWRTGFEEARRRLHYRFHLT